MGPSWACDWRAGPARTGEEAEGDDPMALGVLAARAWSARIASVRDEDDGDDGDDSDEGDEYADDEDGADFQ